MAKKSKLLLALDAHKGRDYDKEKQKKLAKAAEKKKKMRQQAGITSNGEEVCCSTFSLPSEIVFDRFVRLIGCDHRKMLARPRMLVLMGRRSMKTLQKMTKPAG